MQRAFTQAAHGLKKNYPFRSEVELYINLATGRIPALNSNALNEIGLKILNNEVTYLSFI